MGQIVRRKKKGRPSKVDLARRFGESPANKKLEVRRSLRRRNMRYNIDYDDFLDEDEDEEGEREGERYEEGDEDEEGEGEGEGRKREKKLKLVVKLSQGTKPKLSGTRTGAHGFHVPQSASEEDYEDEGERKSLKKRRINSGDNEEEDEYYEEEGNRDDGNDDDDDEERDRKVDRKKLDFIPGTPTGPQSSIPVPDKKTLELILDKLQKKDTYGVYAEPVDPEELPDYHDVIEHPMDFATVRKKLANGSYSILEEFESDVFLLCSNAMQYNAPDTIYHKQARSIQELAKKKFEKLRVCYERSHKELKLVQKTKPNSTVKRLTKKPLCRTSEEAVGSDISSGATIAVVEDGHHRSNPEHDAGFEWQGSIDGTVDGNLSFNDANLDKPEEILSGKGLFSKSGRKPSLDENRRATYNISNQPVSFSESVFSTFECEIKQLVAVGLHAEYSYARSLARFATNLGPVAWKVASKRIEEALPAECKFGRGWVGEYEPILTPVLMLVNYNQKHTGVISKLHSTCEISCEIREDDRVYKTLDPVKEQPDMCPTSEGRLSLCGPAREPKLDGFFKTIDPVKEKLDSGSATEERSFIGPTRPPPQLDGFSKTPNPVKGQPAGGSAAEGRQSLFSLGRGSQSEGNPSVFCSAGMKSNTSTSGSGNAIHQLPYVKSRNFAEPQRKVEKQVELNSFSLPHNSAKIIGKPFSSNSEVVESKSRHVISNTFVQPLEPFMKLDANGAVPGCLTNGKDGNNFLDCRINDTSESDSGSKLVVESGVSDPVQLMTMLAEKTQLQQRCTYQMSGNTQHPMQSVRRENSNNAAVAAAHAWMSVGAGAFKQPKQKSMTSKLQISADSLFNPSREANSQISQIRDDFPVSGAMQFGSERNRQQPAPVGLGCETPSYNRNIFFPQLASSSDLSRFEMRQPQWLQKKQESLPPDLNISFQSPGSPVKHSSGVVVDSQQPDLALQL